MTRPAARVRVEMATERGQRPAQLFVSGQRPSALPEAGRGGGAQRWWQTPYGEWRLPAEAAAMSSRFPGFQLGFAPHGRLRWMGVLCSGLDPDREYVVGVTYPDVFPDAAPEVTIESPELPGGMPHLLGPRRPCLYLPSQGPRNGYEPGRTTAATLVAWTALWIHAFETWLATGRWPGRAD